MTDAIAHRGPDGEGQWLNRDGQVALGHRRLSIIDLSTDGAQPMHFLQGRYTIVFNGEIYNYVELKARLERDGYQFANHTDTEVIMALYDQKGTDCLKDMDGMFAFALYDSVKEEVFFARDRFGEKPLYYAVGADGKLYFGSEMKTIWAAGLPKTPNRRMVYNYFSKNLLENPQEHRETFYEGISRFPAAHSALMSLDFQPEMRAQCYWKLDPLQRNNDITEAEAAARFSELFRTSVLRRLRSDVPLGSSLSGGLDSSLIVCMIDQIDREKSVLRKTFSAQFPGFKKDERKYQQMVIDQCHVEPHFVNPDEASMLRILPRLLHHQEEPIGSASQCIQYEVFGLARENGVTILLDGQGADEILAGYHSYYAAYFNGIRDSDPARYRREHAEYLTLHETNTINLQHQKNWKTRVKSLIPEGVQNLLLKGHRAAYSGEANLRPEFIRETGQHFHNPPEFPDLQTALHFHTFRYGLETLLRYGDRSSMAHSREVRLPFLNHELVEFIFSLPDNFKIRAGWTKWIMREAMQDIVPKDIVWRKDKIGYEPPQKSWMETDVVQAQLKRSLECLADNGILKNLTAPSDPFNWKVLVTAGTLFE